MTDFESKEYKTLNRSRAEWLLPLLKEIYPTPPQTVLDLGCGHGYNTNLLIEFGITDVTAIDKRAENIRYCVRNISTHAKYKQVDLDDPKEILRLGYFDVCLCFGILHHLESPFQVVKYLSEVADTVFVSSICSIDTTPLYIPYNEKSGITNNTSRISLVPSLSALVRSFSEFGYHIYNSPQPKHPDYKQGSLGRCKRYAFIASHNDDLTLLKVNPTSLGRTKWT